MTSHAPLTPLLRTKHLTLRALHAQDRLFLRELITSPEVRTYLGGPVAVARLESHIAGYLNDARESPHWTIEHKDTPIGLISLSPHKDGADHELSYQLLPGYWRRGYGFEAAKAVLQHASRTMGLQRVIAETQGANTASIRLLDRLGFDLIASLQRFGAQQHIYARRLRSL